MQSIISRTLILVSAVMVSGTALAYLTTSVNELNNIRLRYEVGSSGNLSQRPVMVSEDINVVEESGEYAIEWMGSVWLFNSQEQLDNFVQKRNGYAI